MSANRKTGKWEHLFWPLFAMLVLLLTWQFAVKWSGTKVFPSPRDVGHGLAGLIQKRTLWNDTVDSLRRVAIGFGSALVIGIPFGLVIGLYPALNQVVNPLLQILRPISPIAWIPIAIIVFGVGDHAAISLIFLGALFPIIVSCVDGVANVPIVFRRAGNNFGLNTPRILMKVILPAALPNILVGMRISLGIAWLVVVAAEMIAVDSGLGYLVIDARNSGKRYDLVVGAMLIIGLIGLLLDLAIRRLERIKMVQWGFRHEY
jgi:NitT/TauT family transport system permease protein